MDESIIADDLQDADATIGQDENSYEIDSLIKKRLDLLNSIIVEINAQIIDRKALRNGALKEIEQELKDLSALLNEVAPLGRSQFSGRYLDSLNARRIHLERGIARLNELKRTHKINTWKDIVALKRDLFRLLPEYSELMELKKVINSDKIQ